MSTTHTISLATLVLACIAIISIGVRFLLVPQAAVLAYGVSVNDIQALTAIKGVRDITSGIIPLVVWRTAGRKAFGWVMVAAAATPVGDMAIVLARGGTFTSALAIHGLTAGVLIAAGLGLARQP
jgi:hypothetical protein